MKRNELWTTYRQLTAYTGRTLNWPAVSTSALRSAIDAIHRERAEQAERNRLYDVEAKARALAVSQTSRTMGAYPVADRTHNHWIEVVYVSHDDEKQTPKYMRFSYESRNQMLGRSELENAVWARVSEVRDSWEEKTIVSSGIVGGMSIPFMGGVNLGSGVRMRGATLTYPTIGMMPDERLKIADGECCYSHIKNEIGYDADKVNGLLEISGTSMGLTAEQVVAVFKSANQSVRIFDLIDDVITEYIDPSGNSKILAFYCHNNHLSRISPEDADRMLLKRSSAKACEMVHMIDNENRHEDAKRKEIPIINRLVNTWEEAMEVYTEEVMDCAEQDDPRFIPFEIRELGFKYADWKKSMSEKLKAIRGDKAERARQRILIADERAKGKRLYEQQVNELNERYARLKASHKSELGRKLHIYVAGMENLYLPWRNLISSKGSVYKANLQDKHVGAITLTHGVQIKTGKDYNDAIEMAENLEIEYKGESVLALTEKLWRQMSIGWIKSVVNKEVNRLMNDGEATRVVMGGVVYVPETYTPQKGEELHGADFYKCYASVAMAGDFYTIDVMSEVEPYDGTADRAHIYYVETKPGFLFKDVGVYDYEIVLQGLADGVITHDDIKYQVAVSHENDNDKILRKFITDIFTKVVNQNTAKLAVNSQIGKFAKSIHKGKYNTVITSNDMEASYYYNKNKSKHTKRSIDVLCEFNESPVYAVAGYREKFSHSTDLLVNGAISQRAKVLAWRLMRTIEKMPNCRIVAVKTDSVKYVCKTQYPTTSERKWGAIRYEDCKSIQHNEFKKTEPYLSGLKKYEMEAPQWVKIAPVDDVVGCIMSHDRLLITGYAGTGKSYIARDLEKRLIEDGKKVKMASYTHMASINIGGQTLHSVFGMDLEGNVSAKHMGVFQDEVDVLILDELSMFNIGIFNILSQLGGKLQIYGFGDFGQARPVGDENVDYYNSQMLKSLFDYKNMELVRCRRSDDKFANECRDFLLYGDKLPSGVKSVSAQQWKPEPVINIFARNVERRGVNRDILCREAKRLGVEKNPYRVKCHYEEPNTMAPKKITHNAVEYFNADKMAELCRNPGKYASLINNNDPDEWCPFTIPKKYLSNARHIEGSIWAIDVKYEQVSERKQTGRMFADRSLSLQGMARRIRHTVSDGLYDDADLVNCHPTILSHLCKAKGWATPLLDDYLTNREILLADLVAQYSIDRDTAKMIVLAIINGGVKEYRKHQARCHGHFWIDAFREEMKTIHNNFAEAMVERYALHLEESKKRGKTTNLKASFVNKLLCDSEHRMVMPCIELLQKRGLIDNNYVLCFDGFMVKKGVLTPELLREMEANMLAETGIPGRLVIKPFDEQIPMPAVLEPYAGATLEEFRYVIEKDIDQFPYIFNGLKVIADGRGGGVKNNEMFEVIDPLTDDVGEATLIVKKSKKDGADKGIPAGTPEKFVILKNDVRTVAIDFVKFLRNFSPAYALTCHKLQGQTIRDKYYIHEFAMMKTIFGGVRNIQYTALTRGTCGENITLVRS